MPVNARLNPSQQAHLHSCKVREYFFRAQEGACNLFRFEKLHLVCGIESILIDCLQLSCGQCPLRVPVSPPKEVRPRRMGCPRSYRPEACHAILRWRRAASPTAPPAPTITPRRPPTATRRQLPIAPSPRQTVHWLYTSFTRRILVVPAKTGTSSSRPHRPRGRYAMERNGTKRNRIKSSPLLATPEEATTRPSEATLAPRVRVNGVPSEAAPASFSASRPGINWAKQGQGSPPPSFPRRREPRIPVPCHTLCGRPLPPTGA